MRVLMLTPYLPFPLWSGGQIRTYNLLKHLSKKHKITLFSFIRSEKEKQYIFHLKKYCADVKVFLKRPPWSLKSLTLAAASFYPLVVCMYLRNEVRKSIREAIEKERFDLIHAETFYVMPNIPPSDIPIILVEQTIEYLVYQHYTQTVDFLPKRLLMNWDVIKIHFWENKFWQKASKVVAMSEVDKKTMEQLVPNLSVDLAPNGVDTDFFYKKNIHDQKLGKVVLFVGNFKWLQNREAVSILVTKIWPEIKKALPDTYLWIVGRFPSKEILSLACPSIKVSDDIDDIREAYTKSDVLLAPIFGPGGTRYKILEAMAMGLPVVTTKIGIEGLGVKNGQEALICNDLYGLSRETVRVLTNPQLYQRLATRSRRLVENNFKWQKIANSLDRIYEEAAYEQKR